MSRVLALLAGCLLLAAIQGVFASNDRSHVCPPGQLDKSCLPPAPARTTTTAAPATSTIAAPVTTETMAAPVTTTTTAAPASSSSCSGIAVSPASDLQGLIDAYGPGTTFCLQAGVYRLSGPIVPKSYDRLIGEPGAVLNGSKVLTGFLQSGSYWVVGGQTQESAPYGSCLSDYLGCQRAEGVYLDDRNLWQVTSLAELGPGEFYFDYAADRIYLADNPAGRKVEVSVTSEALIGYGTSQGGVTVSGLVMEKFTNADGATVRTGEGWAVENNEIRLNHGAGVFANTGVVVRGNNLHHNGQYGVVGSAADILVESNEIAFNNTEGFDPKWDAGGSKFSRTTNLRLIGNLVHDNNGPGLATDTDNRATLYERNTVWSNTGPGIVHEISFSATVRGNVLENNASGTAGKSIWWGADLLMYDAVDVDIYDNTIISRNNGIGLVDIARGSGPFGVYETRNVRVHDNEIRMKSGTTGLVGSDATFSKGNVFQNNRYLLADPNGRYFAWRGTSALTRKEWQAQGQDTTGSFLQL